VIQEGDRIAYYIAAFIYIIACVLLLVGLWKYNRSIKTEGDIE